MWWIGLMNILTKNIFLFTDGQAENHFNFLKMKITIVRKFVTIGFMCISFVVDINGDLL